MQSKQQQKNANELVTCELMGRRDLSRDLNRKFRQKRK